MACNMPPFDGRVHFIARIKRACKSTNLDDGRFNFSVQTIFSRTESPGLFTGVVQYRVFYRFVQNPNDLVHNAVVFDFWTLYAHGIVFFFLWGICFQSFIRYASKVPELVVFYPYHLYSLRNNRVITKNRTLLECLHTFISKGGKEYTFLECFLFIYWKNGKISENDEATLLRLPR